MKNTHLLRSSPFFCFSFYFFSPFVPLSLLPSPFPSVLLHPQFPFPRFPPSCPPSLPHSFVLAIPLCLLLLLQPLLPPRPSTFYSFSSPFLLPRPFTPSSPSSLLLHFTPFPFIPFTSPSFSSPSPSFPPASFPQRFIASTSLTLRRPPLPTQHGARKLNKGRLCYKARVTNNVGALFLMPLRA